MVKKFFPLDKNYLLEQAQLLSRPHLLVGLLEQVKARYEIKINPLGLEDSFTIKIRNYNLNILETDNCAPQQNATLLDGFYEKLAAIYRFKFGDNQLQFLWDGNDHLIHYQKTWSGTFVEWTNGFCNHDLFIQAVLDLTVFLPEASATQMIENRMNHFILKHFEVKIHHKKGIVAA